MGPRKKTPDLCSSLPLTVSGKRGEMMPEKDSLIMQREAGASALSHVERKLQLFNHHIHLIDKSVLMN